MKIIRENNDLTIGLNLELYKINYSLVQSINFIFYTDNVFIGVYKTMEDVDIYNNIKLQWNDLKQMKSGVIQYSYTVTLTDNTQYSYNVITDYYLCNNIVEDKPNEDDPTSGDTETPEEPTETRPFYRIGYTEGMPQFILDGEEYAKKIYDEWDESKTSCFGLFKADKQLVFFPLVNTSNITNLGQFFMDCSYLEYVPPLDTSNAIEMTFMFSGCKNLRFIPIFDTSNVTNMSNMFDTCERLTTLDLTHFNTSKVTNMGQMFSYCSGLTSLDLSSFDTSKVTNMQNMFTSCSGLTSLDLSSFDTSNVTNMSYMFGNCSNLSRVDGYISFKSFSSPTMEYYYFYGFTVNSTLRKITFKDIGYHSNAKQFNMSYATNWGVNNDTVTDARKSLIDSLIGYSFNRLMYGYPICTIVLSPNTKAVLTSDEIAQITARGYTIA